MNSVFPLPGEPPKAIEPHLPDCQLSRWQLAPKMWPSHTTKLLNLIVVTALWLDFPGEASYQPHVDLPAIEIQRETIVVYGEQTDR